MWGTSWRQRLRLVPLFAAMAVADRLARTPGSRRGSQPSPPRTAWPAGLSVIIPERAAPAMLDEALTSLHAALAEVPEPVQVIVVVNGAPLADYVGVRARFPDIEWMHDDAPLGFAGAIERGLRHARHGGTYLMNNDMTLDARALVELLPARAADVFAVSSQILQQDASGRREETGFTDWYIDGGGIRLLHAPVPAAQEPVPHLCASGGASLFRTALLREYLTASRCYDPFYWEDVDWSIRAWRDGYRVLFCPRSQAQHRHRATTARFYARDELDRIVERNRVLFDARHGITDFGVDWLMERVCDLPYTSQRELASLTQAAGVFRYRRARLQPLQPLPPPRLSDAAGQCVAVTSSYSFHLRDPGPAAPARPRLLLVTPFAVFPPRHGGARRVAELLRGLRPHYDIMLVSDEASLYDARSFADFDGLCAVRIVQRGDSARSTEPATLAARMNEHCHRPLVEAVNGALRDFAPDLVQVEYAELTPLVRHRLAGARWILGLHDAYGAADFADPADAARFADDLLAYDALTVCSDEDRALVTHPRIESIANGASVSSDGYLASEGQRVLFVGPFRYRPNHDGILAFLRTAWPSIRRTLPGATLTILGGDEHRADVEAEAAFSQPGVEVLGHRDDVPRLLRECTLTINPLTAIRGSAVKLVESLAAGRVCVSTADGARGFGSAAPPGLVVVPNAGAMAEPVIELLAHAGRRREFEVPDAATLAQFAWQHAVARQRSLYSALLRDGARPAEAP